MKRALRFYAFVVILAAIVSCSDVIEMDKQLNEPSQSLAINVLDESGQAISAHALVIKDNQTISEFNLSSGVNHFSLPDLDKPISIVVEKDGFERSVTEVNRKTAFALGGKALKVVLKSLLVLTIETHVDDDTYVIDLDGVGSITIIWPDGTIETSNMPLSLSTEFDEGSSKQIALKGDINGIKSFRAFGYNSTISNFLGLRNMNNLETFLPGNVSLSQQLDLTHNRKLMTVDLFNASLPSWLKLSEQHYINSFTLSLADRNITSNELSNLITNIYNNAVRQNINGGVIALTGSDTPSAKTAKQIATLQSNYGWSIDLNL